ncbi:restriction endonuclease subunit S [Mucilaginibacter flavidus]|uniref:restriction endonuclease subunit S n=1 Tax=Mucilaginibacter flavidus TaxID=2949309 RepID=UPI0020935B14|nr:restriction endonuclease subunit S [Mucilaginibacter flavidus]MCO5950904.1 restriction endonuclease subunit S [Mucilaginibacter flavidus]
MINSRPYEQYQYSGEEWLGLLPGNWKLIKTKNLFSLITEPAPVGNNEMLLSVYTAIGVRPRKELEARGNKASTTDNYWLVQPGDIIVNKLLAWMGAVGISVYQGVTSPAYDILRAKSEVNAQYYNYLFRLPISGKEFKRHSRGIMDMRLRLYFSRFGDIKLPYPSYEEQAQIALFLDYKIGQINRFVSKKKHLITLLNEQKKMIINRAVTNGIVNDISLKSSGIPWLETIPAHWNVRKLKFVAECFPSNVDKKTKEGEASVMLCNYTDVYKHDYIVNDMPFMEASATDEQIERFLLKKGDVVITKDSETANDIAVPAFIKEDLDNIICGYHLSVLRPYDDILGEFLFRLLQSKIINAQFEVRANGVTRVALGVYDLKNAKIPLPPKEEQQQIIEYISRETAVIYKTIGQIEKEIALAQEYRTVLITEAVTGKIDVRSYVIPETSEDITIGDDIAGFDIEEETEFETQENDS